NEYFIIYDFLGRNIIEGKCSGTIKISETNSGIYYLTILNNTNQTTYKLIKK
ncbi:MAG: T9SS type A sorting domain-containing protein, partial [Maribacter sp.]|nr:T9SS type A sorting domain-containing protein [Maribacter sp.]